MEEPARLASDPKKLFSRIVDGILAVAEQIPIESTAGWANLANVERWEKEVQWITLMWQSRLNGILGDQMGSQGMIPALSFLADLKRNGQHGPYMIVTSMDHNGVLSWSNFIREHSNMKEMVYLGNRSCRARLRKEFGPKTVGPDFPIIVTTYNMVLVEQKWLAKCEWKYVIVDEGHELKKWEREMLEEVKRQPMGPMGHKLLLMREPFQNNLAELWSLLNFALPDAFSSREGFDSWFDKSGKEVEEQQTEEERRTLLSKLNAILRPFLLRGMERDVVKKTKVVQNSDAISVTCSNDHAATKGARTDAGSCQEVAARVVGVTGDEVGLEVEANKAIKRPRTNDVSISLVSERNPTVRVQMAKSSSSESIFKALKEIPYLARTDILRAYSCLIRDDRLLESLMALPMDMRKDWLLMEIGSK
ncbi:hypothetical protein CFC21_086273 [Triticum aestivum]|uniref:Helicase ATP-binding domain-containing protein n=2 Tax=Triticum aestivum TaxID=4565 RepID=A0A1D6B098_WHEAT|nr:ATP-dependent DNA helicase DDM1-like [Triticum aestivum]XP_044408781.1 ATP-dependent DNA helicase DDM1-like [Triticum aestivum]KAF7082400.1 hypothetical protein CFC21_086273 [Triticum aestivum]